MTSGINKWISASGAVKTRFATTHDAAALMQIGVQTFHDTFAEYNSEEDMNIYLAKTFTLKNIEVEINDPTITYILAEDNRQIVGYTKLREGNNPKELNGEAGIEIERIYAAKAYIGKNVGKALMETCISIARQRGYPLIWLGVWEHNPRAIAFYEKWGFRKFGSHAFLLGTDIQTDLLMKLKLNK